MREIKFRAWDGSKMWSWEDITKDKEILCSVMRNEFYATIPPKYFWQRQQYTGLKDKNGVEIYEGDIISVTSEEFGECLPEFEHLEYKSQEHFEWITVTRNAEVLYEADGWGGFKIRYLDWYHSLLNHSSTSNPKLVEGFVSNKDGVVVGNIFEGVDK